jgi:hypothetical protein
VLIQFGFVTIVPKYLNFATFSKDLLAVSHHGMAWHGIACPQVAQMEEISSRWGE